MKVGQQIYTTTGTRIISNGTTPLHQMRMPIPILQQPTIGGNLMEGIAELIIQPTVARIGTGSGSSDNTLDHNKDKNKQRKGGRRR